MDASYARQRRTRPHLAFRWRCRAMIAARMYDRFRPHARPPVILDLGSADGLAMAETHRLLDAARSVGIEYAPDLISHAQLPPRCEILQGDVTQSHPDVPDTSFDLVTALAVLEHVDNSVSLARRVHAALRPGGVFIATCPYPLWDRISGTLRLHRDEHHAVAYTRSRFEAFARAGNLTPLLYRRFMFAPIGFLPYLGLSPSPRAALAIDAVVGAIPIISLACVNQVFVARRPG
jgi:SAM-dependent methyltransferase